MVGFAACRSDCACEGAVRPRHAGATMWVCGATAAWRSHCVRVRCDRSMQERLCEGAVRLRQPCASVPPFHFENFRQAWQKCVAKYGNARPRPKQDKYVVLRTRSTSVKKERWGFPSRD